MLRRRNKFCVIYGQRGEGRRPGRGLGEGRPSTSPPGVRQRGPGTGGWRPSRAQGRLHLWGRCRASSPGRGISSTRTHTWSGSCTSSCSSPPRDHRSRAPRPQDHLHSRAPRRSFCGTRRGKVPTLIDKTQYIPPWLRPLPSWSRWPKPRRGPGRSKLRATSMTPIAFATTGRARQRRTLAYMVVTCAQHC